MSFLVLFQIAINVGIIAFLAIMWQKFRKPPAEDPRLSRGLQLLQSKITVLEDLSDRTDRQVEQLMSLLEQKGRFVQKTILDAETEIQKIDQATQRSKEVAEIFQDKIPHDEIIERQNTIKYVKAAQLAHQGVGLDEIARHTDLPMGEVEFIAKVNKDQLMFDLDQLPEWARSNDWVEESLEPAKKDLSSLKKLGDEFRKAVRDVEEKQKLMDEEPPIVNKARELSDRLISVAKESLESLGHQFLEKTSPQTTDQLAVKKTDATDEILS